MYSKSDLGSHCSNVFLQWPGFTLLQQYARTTTSGQGGCLVYRKDATNKQASLTLEHEEPLTTPGFVDPLSNNGGHVLGKDPVENVNSWLKLRDGRRVKLQVMKESRDSCDRSVP
jgi:hypothetical protein